MSQVDELITVENIPFEKVPKELIEQIRPYADPPSYEEWSRWCPYLDKSPIAWNLGLIDEEGRLVAFYYGTWDACGGGMHVIRAMALPQFFGFSGQIARRGLEDIRNLAKKLGARRIYFVTTKWKAFLRKMPDHFRLTEARVLEVEL